MIDLNRTTIDFDNEIRSISKHEEVFTRPRLSVVMNNIYIPKFKVKSFSSYMYGGENNENYSKYDISNNHNNIFNNPKRSRDSVILGIESSFDDSSAALINSYGEIKSNVQLHMWD